MDAVMDHDLACLFYGFSMPVLWKTRVSCGLRRLGSGWGNTDFSRSDGCRVKKKTGLKVFMIKNIVDKHSYFGEY
jgi:hypothetical protein